MKSTALLSFILISIAIFFIISCNDSGEVKNNVVSDTTSTEMSETAPAFDTSRSVTTISPDLYKKLADTLNIKMLAGTYRPGDSSIMHAHPDFALYVLEGSLVELTMTDGSKQNIDFKKDMAVVLPAASHSAKNIGPNTLKLIVVEVNRPRK